MARWIYGRHAVLERLGLEKPGLTQVVLAKGQNAKEAEEIVKAASRSGVRVEWRERRWLEDRAGSNRHQGVVAAAEEFQYAELADILETAGTHATLVVLDGVEDPGNLGAILRSAECAGASGVLIPKDRAVQVTAVVEKASAGAAGRVKVASVTNINRVLEELKKSGYWIYGLSGEAKESLYSVKFEGKVCLVLGGEGGGIRPLVRQNCDLLVSIPMSGKVSSLNVSVAAGVSLFEIQRQRFQKDKP
ncbi:MAG: 23S rRNA (guanosine(2251)-2'-O)-methyltransferase RlmB [candidate division FCPU426 bacterium]